MTDIPAVLIVKDDVKSLFNTAFNLREVGFKVYQATNADTAIERLVLHDDIRVMYTDIDVDGAREGLKLSAVVRHRWPQIKVMVTSGRRLGDLDIMPDGVMFMQKPYQYETLTRSVTRLSASYRPSQA